MKNNIKLYLGKAEEILPSIESNSVDLINCDPPYGYSFMGKDWDTFNEVVKPGGAYEHKKGFNKLPRNKPFGMIKFFVPIWKECLRVLKPGGFAFVMCAPRQDVLCKQIIALQEAGFRTDFSSIYWCYFSGFPKASNIGKIIDKKECKKQLTEKLGRKPTKKEFEDAWENYREVIGSKIGQPGYSSKKESIKSNTYQGGVDGSLNNSINKTYITEPKSPEAKQLDGSYGGFQPKPAVEIIIVAMKSLQKSDKEKMNLDFNQLKELKQLLCQK